MELANRVREAATPLRDLAQRARRRFLRMREERRRRRDARYVQPNSTRSLYVADILHSRQAREGNPAVEPEGSDQLDTPEGTPPPYTPRGSVRKGDPEGGEYENTPEDGTRLGSTPGVLRGQAVRNLLSSFSLPIPLLLTSNAYPAHFLVSLLPASFITV